MTAIVKTKHEEVLGFDPTSKEKNVFKIIITPYMAQYILDHLNNNNRKIVEGQIAAIRRSAALPSGWLWDGGAIVFTTEGNIIEFQHRLKVIVERDEDVEVIVVTGVDPEVFTLAAPAKNRTVTDSINKVDKTATSDEVTVLRQLIKRRAGQDAQAKGVPKLTMQTAVELWDEWKTYVRSGMRLTADFFNGDVTSYNPWERQFNAWASLMEFRKRGDLVKPFLDTFKQHKLKKTNSTLFAEFEEFLKEDAVIFLAGENKARMIHIMLCHATDRFELNKSGNVEFDFTVAKACHSGMLSKGTYRDFLYNPQGLDIN
jgi:hypothetical protein|tara:strand:- start:19 stop:963 length:945 start_codon:yes stop_codon:yes gene_type:complete